LWEWKLKYPDHLAEYNNVKGKKLDTVILMVKNARYNRDMWIPVCVTKKGNGERVRILAAYLAQPSA